SYAMYEEPEKLHERAKRNVEASTAAACKFENSGLIDGYALCSDYCFNVNPFFSVEMFDEFVVPYLRRIISVYHDMGFYVIKHTDGNIMPIAGKMVDCGPDALHSIDPQAGVDLAEVKRLYGDRVCLIGNVNCGLLQTGTDEDCAADILRSLRQGMEGWGYVFSTSNCVYTGMPLRRYELMQRIWREHGVYK
ncbi:MAG: uroporphyrinogen decarboxylase family protein, partial [Prolixibacteraceae bacterium]|nr:uroporphyrinogen decarboxylase family protein [Prolixibacteraceae bacterium]